MAAADRDLQAAIAVTRFGLGARPGEIAAVRADPRGWLTSQITPQGADQPRGPNGPLPSLQQSYAVVTEYQAALRSIRDARRPQGQAAPPPTPEPAMMRDNAMGVQHVDTNAVHTDGDTPPRA